MQENLLTYGHMKISGNTILITGGATGIGYALAEYFLKEGNEVIITGRRKDKLLEAQKKHPELQIFASDITSESDRKDLKNWISSDFSNFNILVNNAGVQREIDFKQGIDEFNAGENEIVVNLEAPIILTGLFIPLLTSAKEAAIVNISSGLGFLPSAKAPVYSASKAGIHAFSMALRYQLLKTSIKVFEIIPPVVDTELNPAGRSARGNFRAGVSPDEFVSGVMESFKNDIVEIGYGMTEGLIKASREELDARFQQMNSRW